jgi:AcrR family transcriptional regulator
MNKEDDSRYHHGNLRQALLDAALKQLGSQADDTLSLRELAKSLGVSIAAVYRHFPSKDALLAVLAAEGFRRLVADWEMNLPSAEVVGAEARFQRLGEMYVSYALNTPALYRLMFLQNDLRAFPELHDAAAQCFHYVLDAARGTVAEAGADDKWSFATASAAWSLVHGYVMLTLGGRLAGYGDTPLTPALLPRFLHLPKDVLP